MRIQHNISALNSYNKLAGNNNRLAKNLEKLSSGYSINRAADNAAGLAISEKMRAQITGLETCQQNSKDGISLVQTAEGALTEVHSMLNRMVALTTQASNGIYTDQERTKIQDELDQLNEEIDRIADATNFNGIKLLDGSLNGGSTGGAPFTSSLTIGENEAVASIDQTEATAANKLYGANSAGLALAAVGDKVDVTVALDNGKSYTVNVELKAGDSKAFQLYVNGEKVGGESDTNTDVTGTATNGYDKIQQAVSDVLTEKMSDQFKVEIKVGKTDAEFKFTANEAGANGPRVKGVTVISTLAAGDQKTSVAMAGTSTKDGADATYYIKQGDITIYDGTSATEKKAVFEIDGKKFAMADITNGTDVSKLKEQGIIVLDSDGTAATASVAQQLSHYLGKTVKESNDVDGTGGGVEGFLISGSADGGNGLRLQIGETNDTFNMLDVNVKDCHANAIGVGTATMRVDDVDTANQAMMAAKDAVEYVSAVRSKLGAIQNRLDHTLANLEETTTNLTDAESRIRDTDMAQEMMKYTKNNILIQSSQAMLAQANQVPQGVLQLLQ